MSLVKASELSSQLVNQSENGLIASNSIGKDTFDSLDEGEIRNIGQMQDRDLDFSGDEVG